MFVYNVYVVVDFIKETSTQKVVIRHQQCQWASKKNR